MIDFALPSLGADMSEGTLLTWHVQPGDTVSRGQVVAVVDTSKAAVDVEIWQDGVVDALLVQPGEKVPVGTVLARLRTAQETPSAPLQAPQPVAPSAPAAPRLRISPAARQRAQVLGLDPSQLQGTGANGAITLADVEAATHTTHVTHAPETAPTSSPTSSPTPTPTPSPAQRQAAMRSAIAATMSRSKREIPHYYLSHSINLSPALEALQSVNQNLALTERILPTVLLLKAVALALQHTPELNGFYLDGQFQPSAAVHLGVAISLRGGGLVAPALHDVAEKTPAQLMQALADLVKRARAGSLRSSEMSDPTLTVTHLGDQGVEEVMGVIYPPQVALVGFGSALARPWVLGRRIAVQTVVRATLAADHRVSDGHRGALFLRALDEVLQTPAQLFAPQPPKTPIPKIAIPQPPTP
jgi:pyruvate dehydrogenase E2 component (dihydrolipoamide acetyltransferase)